MKKWYVGISDKFEWKEKDTIWFTQKKMGKMNYNVLLRNTIMVPSRTSGTKLIMVVEALAVVELNF